MNSLKYLEAALLETLRLHPSVPINARKALVDFDFGKITGDEEKYGGYIVRKGDELLLNAYAMGRLPWIWGDDCTLFKPERFYDGKSNKVIEYPPCKFPAFNLNPRYCLGKTMALLEAKIAVVSLFRKYKHISIVPGQKIQCVVSATHQMKYGMRLFLEE